MKRTIIFLILTWLGVSFGLDAQAKHPEYDPYMVHKTYAACVYVDNLICAKSAAPHKVMSDIFDSVYYSHIEISDIKGGNKVMVDHSLKQLFCSGRTPKAKDGYRYVNKCITYKINHSDCKQDTVKITYVYNNKEVTTQGEVKKVVRLRKRKIRIQELILDERKGLVTVYIVDK